MKKSMNDDETQIRNMYERWADAVRSNDIEAYIACLDKKITMRPLGGPTIDGHDGYREFLKPVFSSAKYDSDGDGEHQIEIFGDFAIVRVRHTIHLKFEGSATSIQSEGALQKEVNISDYLDVLKRQDDGNWKVLVHTWMEVED